MNTTRQAVLNLLTQHPRLTTNEIAATVHIAPNSVGYHLRALETAGTITRIIAGRHTHWTVAQHNKTAA